MIKKLFFIAALLVPGLAYGGPSANLPVQIVPAGSGVTGSILPFLPPGTTQWVYMGGDEFNGSSVDYSFWNTTAADGALLDGQICQVRSAITESGGTLNIVGRDPAHCAQQPPYPANGVCSQSCAGGEIVSNFPGNSFGPGYYEARIFNKGAFYLAFWNEGIHADCQSPAQGGTENDILEGYGGTYQNNIHWGGYGSCHMSMPLTGLGPDDDGYHLYGLRWDPTDGLRFYRDGVETDHFAGPVGNGVTDVRLVSMAYDDTYGPMQVDWFRYFQAQ
jgi:hypothetical protein